MKTGKLIRITPFPSTPPATTKGFTFMDALVVYSTLFTPAPIQTSLKTLQAINTIRGIGTQPAVTPNNLTHISMSQAQALNFPYSKAEMGQVYVQHPVNPSTYIPIKQFHYILFEEKTNELINILASLGATHIKVEHQQGYENSSSIHAKVSGPVQSIGVGASQNSNTKQSKQVLFEERYRPTHTPCIPDDTTWLQYEASWHHLAQRRLKYNTKSFSVLLKYDQDYSINANIELGLRGAGIDFGGGISKFQNTTWRFSGEFL